MSGLSDAQPFSAGGVGGRGSLGQRKRLMSLIDQDT